MLCSAGPHPFTADSEQRGPTQAPRESRGNEKRRHPSWGRGRTARGGKVGGAVRQQGLCARGRGLGGLAARSEQPFANQVVNR